jgi:hypothetical protein
MCMLTQRSLVDGQLTISTQVTEGQLDAGPLTVSLYGEISSAAPRSIQLEAPSPSRIRPFKWPGQDTIHFSSATFRCSGSSPRRRASSKRSRTALDEAWRFAVDLALEADATLNDGLPSNLSSYRVGIVRIHERKIEESMGRVDSSTNSSKIPGLTSDAFCWAMAFSNSNGSAMVSSSTRPFTGNPRGTRFLSGKKRKD